MTAQGNLVDVEASKSGTVLNLQAENAIAVTKSDSTVLSPSTLYVGGAGDVAVTMAGGQVVTFSAVPAGTFMPILVTKVMSTNTTATLVLALN